MKYYVIKRIKSIRKFSAVYYICYTVHKWTWMLQSTFRHSNSRVVWNELKMPRLKMKLKSKWHTFILHIPHDASRLFSCYNQFSSNNTFINIATLKESYSTKNKTLEWLKLEEDKDFCLISINKIFSVQEWCGFCVKCEGMREAYRLRSHDCSGKSN